MSATREWIKTAYEKGYRVDDEGNVIAPSGKKRALRLKESGGNRNSPRYVFTVWYEGKAVPVPVHQLAAFQKFGDFEEPVVRHLNGDPFDNSPANVKPGTQSENMLDRVEHARTK